MVRWRNRLLAEKAIMRSRFPQFILTCTHSDLLVWRGILEPVRSAAFGITATMPANYPYSAPELRVERPRLRPGAPHLYANGTLCIHKQNWDPMRSTVASTIPLAAAWLISYLNWSRTGEAF
jgi:ubiquitin-protein ligase